VSDVPRLSAPDEHRLRAQNFTYPGVGATSAPPYPSGFSTIDHRAALGTGRADFEAAAELLMGWQMHARALLRPMVSAARAAPGAVVLMHAGVGPLAMPVPCRVIYTVDEPDRRGFAYGTLPGHPESGEERFVVELGPDGRVTLSVTGFSRPGRLLTRLLAPVTERAARLAIRGYGRVLRQ
jgi:uncharacterized protein (UPF0548 family)